MFRELYAEQAVTRPTEGEENWNTEGVERGVITETDPRVTATVVTPLADELSKLDGAPNCELLEPGGAPNPTEVEVKESLSGTSNVQFRSEETVWDPREAGGVGTGKITGTGLVQ